MSEATANTPTSTFAAKLEAAARRRPWIGDHGFYFQDHYGDDSGFYWFREQDEARALAGLLLEPSEDWDDEFEEGSLPLGFVEWEGPIESLMHSRHEIAARARYWFWLSRDPDCDPYVPDVLWGWARLIVQAVSEDELHAFGKFLAEEADVSETPWG